MLTALLVNVLALRTIESLSIPAKVITFRSPAQTADRLLAAISKRYAVPLSADRLTGGEILLVSVRKMPLPTFMKGIAEVAAGEWRKAPRGFQLVSSEAALARNEATLQAFRLSNLRTVISELKRNHDPSDIIFSDHEQPGATKLLIAIGAERLAAVRPGQRVVWATDHPTPMQQKLDGDFGPIFKQWIDGYNATVRKWQEMTKGTHSMKKELIEKPFYKATVAVTGGYGTPSVEICAYGSKGRLVTAPITVHMDDFEMADDVNSSNGKPAFRRFPITVSADTKRVDSAYRKSRDGSKLPSLAARKLAGNPERDPLSFYTSDAYLSLAAARHKDLIADLPDSAMVTPYGKEPNAETIGEFFDREYGGKLKQRIEGNCLLLSPVSVRECRRQRVPREVLRRLAHLDAQLGWVPLDDMAQLAAAIPEPPIWFLNYCQASLLPEFPSLNDTGWGELQLYAALSPAQRKTLWNGGEVKYRDLTPKQTELVKSRLFSNSVGRRGDPRKIEPLMDTALNLWVYVFDNREPTELMPDGLPQDGALIGTPGSEPALRFVDSQGHRLAWIASAKDLIHNIVGGPWDSFAGGTHWQATDWPSHAILGSRKRLRITYTIAADIFERDAVTEYRQTKDAPKVFTKTLPPVLKKMVDQYVRADRRH